MNLWPYLSGKTDTSPRSIIHLDVGVVLQGDLKILMSESKQACWAGPQFPNASDPACTREEKCSPCLYNISADREENNDLAKDPAFSSHLASMQKLVASLDAAVFQPDRGKTDKRACDQAERNGNFWGPWLE
jgi:arylsulfatase I/J